MSHFLVWTSKFSNLKKEVVQEQIQKGKLVIFSSHQMNYVEEFCEDIIILHHGDVVLQGNVKQLKKEYGKKSNSTSSRHSRA